MRPRRAVVLAAALAFLSLALSAADKAKVSDPLNITEGVLDEIALKAAKPPEPMGLVVRRFPSDKADVGTAKEKDNEKRNEAVKIMQNEGPRILAESILKTLGEGKPYTSVKESEEPAPAGALVVEGRFTTIDPGSKAKRFWAGFGAGQSGIAVEGVVRSADGAVLAEFKHRRSSGMGLGGGDYVKFLTDDTRDVGHDIAVFLQRWASGGDLRKGAD